MLGKVKSGILQLLTLGGLGIWSSIDLIVIASKCEGKDTKNIKRKQFNFAIIACTLVSVLNVCTLIIGLNNINDLKFKLLNTTGFADYNGFTDYNDFIDYTNSNKVMRVFMYSDATDEEIYQLEEDLSKIEGIDSIIYVSKEEAYNSMKNLMEENQELMSTITADIFSVSYEITVEKLSKSDEIYNEVILLDNVKDVINDYETLKMYNNIKTTINVGVIFASVLVVLHILILILTICVIKNNIKKKGDETDVL